MIYAITGEVYSGKTTFAKELAKRTGLTVKSFSEGPRDVAALVTGLGFNNNWQALKTQPLPDVWSYGEVKTGRELVMRIAEDMKLVLGKDVWARMLIAYTQNVIIDDLRFVAEWDIIKQFPHKIIRTTCEDRYERAAKLGDPITLLREAQDGDREVGQIIAHYTVNTSLPYDINRFL
jgi:hypothetical protein